MEELDVLRSASEDSKDKQPAEQLDVITPETPSAKEELQAATKKLGEKIAEKQQEKVESLIEDVAHDNHVDEEKLAELDRSLTNEQKQIIMRQFLEEFMRRKRRRAKATKKKITFKQRKKKRNIAKASRRKNRK